MRIEGDLPGNLDIECFYMPGIRLYAVCGECQKLTVVEKGQSYIAYPKLEGPNEISFHCETCDHEWIELLFIEFNISAQLSPAEYAALDLAAKEQK